MSALLEIKGLYGGYEKGVNILQGINLTVEQGETVGIIGLNGSGKSTLGKAVMNLLPYRRGKILFDGQHIENKTTHELVQMGIAMMHQGGTVFPNLSVWENLQLAAGNSQSSFLSSQLKDVIPLLQKPKKELAHIKADKLSGGLRHELTLAMTLIREPRLIVLDEPSVGLSPKAIEDMYVIFQQVRDVFGVAIMLIEQNIAHAVEFVFFHSQFMINSKDSDAPLSVTAKNCEKCFILSQGKIEHVFNKENELNISEIESLIF